MHGNALPNGYKLPRTERHAYEIVRVLGEGGCGITYLARNLKSFVIPDTNEVVPEGEYLAIKECYSSDYMYRDEYGHSHIRPGYERIGIHLRVKFIDEAQHLYNLWDLRTSSDYVRFVPYYHVAGPVQRKEEFGTPGIYYLVMPYLRGGTYKALKGRLAAESIVLSLYDLLQTLSLLHERGVSHLDIKPENIMLGNQNRPVLIDFGMAEKHQYTQATGYTMNYAAPEQLQGVAVTAQSGPMMDVYSLGVTFYELITGQLPTGAAERIERGTPVIPLRGNENLLAVFSSYGKTIEAEAEKKNGRPHRLKARAASFAYGLLSSIDMALNYKPEDRLSCRAWLEDLFDGVNPYRIGATGFHSGRGSDTQHDSGDALNTHSKWVIGSIIGLLSVVVIVLVVSLFF